jgi:PIN domain nuclease of toxin-antitoxin system
MAKRVLPDTHVVIEIGSTGGLEKMPARVRRILEDPDIELLFSVVSRAEVAMKNAIGKLQLGKDELAAICENASIDSYSLRQPHIDKLFELPLHHKDPFDRLIISTALSDGIPLISRDNHFRKYKGLKVIW